MGKKVAFEELERAVRRLEEALALPKNDIIRDSVIQRFEFTVELSWKTLARVLDSMGVSVPAAPKNIIREAAKLALLVDAEFWILVIDHRNLSSHTYKEDLAELVYGTAQKTPPLVRDLLNKMKATQP